ncbi:hypothetical protein MOQ72_26900 [Saccharopolyspora sp. K220]|uniref:hypothetical protein n=1 Tax=Saccharopolyspora soli TaxID=2926618 RepID=UPI001F587243|nr:hypothetical protein [Saccharopolyspora soli]MCI2421077.1 hypothetical protein [Saccharopolyspora soli]
MKAKNIGAVVGFAAVALVAAGGVASAATYDEVETSRGWVSVSYDDARNAVVASSSQDEVPWIEHQVDFLGWADLFTAKADAESWFGHAESYHAYDGPYRACINVGVDAGGGSSNHVICTDWVNGR